MCLFQARGSVSCVMGLLYGLHMYSTLLPIPIVHLCPGVSHPGYSVCPGGSNVNRPGYSVCPGGGGAM